MAFHQLEKVLARAATNRSFRDELAAGDADLDELGLSDDEQSVLSELVASSGAGLDAVLNVVTALPAGAIANRGAESTGQDPQSMQSMSSMQPAQSLSNVSNMQSMHNIAGPGQVGNPVMPSAAVGPTPATTTPAFALMTPGMASAGTVTPGLAAVTPAASTAMPTAMPAGYPMPAQAIPGLPAGYPMATGGMPAGYPTQSGTTTAGYPAQGTGMPAGYAPMPYQPTQDMNGMPTAGQSANNPTGVGSSGPQRALDAGDVGRPVVARLPFGMDVVK